MNPVSGTRTARILRAADGIVVARIPADRSQGIQERRDNIAACARACTQAKAPLLVDIRQSAPLDAETRHYYSGRQLTDYFTALALLVPVGAFGRVMGNVYLRVARPGIPS